jgi:hypothetical protein
MSWTRNRDPLACNLHKSHDARAQHLATTYDNGTRRDLRITRTDSFNPTPTALVSDPVAELPRSALTKDGQFVLYFTDKTPSGATLHVRSMDGTDPLSLPNVVDVVAAHDSLVFTDNSSDPNQYPVVTDLKALNLAAAGEPSLIESKIVEGRNFQLDSTGTQIVYVRSGVDRDAGPDRDGMFSQAIP